MSTHVIKWYPVGSILGQTMLSFMVGVWLDVVDYRWVSV